LHCQFQGSTAAVGASCSRDAQQLSFAGMNIQSSKKRHEFQKINRLFLFFVRRVKKRMIAKLDTRCKI